MRASRKLSGRFRVGDWVSLDYGLRKITAQVVEDRGLLGVHGRRLYRVRPMPSRGESFDFELAEEELEAGMEPDEARSDSPCAGATPIPRSFDVIYIRQGDTRKWVATTRPTTGNDAVKARARSAIRPRSGKGNRKKRNSQSSTYSWSPSGDRRAVRHRGRSQIGG